MSPQADDPVYVVLDEDGEPCHSASWPEACHERINEAAESELDVSKWVVRTAYPESIVREFIGWLSGDVPELHAVEVPKLAESWERFKEERL